MRKKLTNYARGMSFQFSFSTKATWLYTVFWQWGCLVWLAPGHDTSSWESFCSQEAILWERPVYILVAAEGTSNSLFWAAHRDLWRPRPWWSEIFIIWARSSDQSADVDKDKRSRCASHLTQWNMILTAKKGWGERCPMIECFSIQKCVKLMMFEHRGHLRQIVL